MRAPTGAALPALLALAAAAGPAALQAQEGPGAVHVVAEAGVLAGDGVGGAAVEVGRPLRLAPELLVGGDGAVGAASVLYLRPSGAGGAVGVYGGLGLAWFLGGGRGHAGMARVGVEVPLPGGGRALRLEVRGLSGSHDALGVVAGFRFR